MNRKIQLKELKVTSSRPYYGTLASLLNGMKLYGQTPLSRSYIELAGAVKSRSQHQRKMWEATVALLQATGHRLGLTERFMSKVGADGEVSKEDAEWIIDTLVHYADRRRYNTTDIEACKVLGHALASLHGIESIGWIPHYKYAPPRARRDRRLNTPL